MFLNFEIRVVNNKILSMVPPPSAIESISKYFEHRVGVHVHCYYESDEMNVLPFGGAHYLNVIVSLTLLTQSDGTGK